MIRVKRGEIITVTISRVRVADQDDDGSIQITDEHGVRYAMPPQAAITRLNSDWPPQHQDVWADTDGDHWYARLMDDDFAPDGPYIEFIPGKSSKDPEPPERYDLDAINDRRGPFTLLLRNGEQVLYLMNGGDQK